IVRADLARKAEGKATALKQGMARGRWRRLLMKFIFFGVVVVVVGLLASCVPGPLSTPCGRSSLWSGGQPLVAGECIESEKGSRYFGGLLGQTW
ncbi:unnamed protein product, partial [Pylaiella littoralis]